jgi:type II secretory pathway component HofQ
LLGDPLTADDGTRNRTNTNTLTGIVSDVVEATALSGASFFKYLFGAETKAKRKKELIILLKPRII